MKKMYVSVVYEDEYGDSTGHYRAIRDYYNRPKFVDGRSFEESVNEELGDLQIIADDFELVDIKINSTISTVTGKALMMATIIFKTEHDNPLRFHEHHWND